LKNLATQIICSIKERVRLLKLKETLWKNFLMVIMDKDEIQLMIDQSVAKAIDKHNKTASIISACIGSILLGFYAHGLIAVVNNIK